jgi:hypothetical protein
MKQHYSKPYRLLSIDAEHILQLGRRLGQLFVLRLRHPPGIEQALDSLAWIPAEALPELVEAVHHIGETVHRAVRRGRRPLIE